MENSNTILDKGETETAEKISTSPANIKSFFFFKCNFTFPANISYYFSKAIPFQHFFFQMQFYFSSLCCFFFQMHFHLSSKILVFFSNAILRCVPFQQISGFFFFFFFFFFQLQFYLSRNIMAFFKCNFTFPANIIFYMQFHLSSFFLFFFFQMHFYLSSK